MSQSKCFQAASVVFLHDMVLLVAPLCIIMNIIFSARFIKVKGVSALSSKRYVLDFDGTTLHRDLPPIKILYVSSATYGGDWHSFMHAHDCTELFYVVSGTGQFKVEDHLFPVSADDMVILNPNVEHTELSRDNRPLEYIVLGVDGLEFSPPQDGDSRYCVLQLQSQREAILPNLRSLLREAEGKLPGYELVCQNILEILAVQLNRRAEFSSAPGGRYASKECALVRRYIDSHFKENITLSQLSDLVHINKYYLVHTFSQEYGISPISYLISRRLQESKYLLSRTNHSLSQISHMLGFSSPSYFSQSFRRAEKMSPLEYRKLCHAKVKS